MMGLMTFHLRLALHYVKQFAADFSVLAWAVAWWFVGRFVSSTIAGLAEPARKAQAVSSDLGARVSDVADRAGALPAAGPGLQQRFEAMTGPLQELSASAGEQVAEVERIAMVMGWVAFLIPTTLMVAVWVPRRLASAARAREVRELMSSPDGTSLLALRALATQPLSVLRTVASNPATAWRADEPETMERLAELEMLRAGVRPRSRRRA